jgi:putative FmdB family regulatory protein
MPLYEYGCDGCGTVSEISHRLSEPSPTDCPSCGAPKLSKLISAAAFRLKGGGWYETDFKSDGKRNLAGDSADAKPDAGKSETKTETKTDTKTESKPAAAAAASCGTGACGACT